MILGTFLTLVNALSFTLPSNSSVNLISQGVSIPNSAYVYRFASSDWSEVDEQNPLIFSLTVNPTPETSVSQSYKVFTELVQDRYYFVINQYGNGDTNIYYRLAYTDSDNDTFDSGFLYGAMKDDRFVYVTTEEVFVSDGGFLDFYFYWMDADIYRGYINESEDFTDGYNAGYSDGETAGYDSGYQDGYDTKFEEDYDTYYNIGYNDGYNEGISSDGNMVLIFSNIFQFAMIPVNFFLKIFNVEVFGINVSGLVSALLTMAIIIILLKSILGNQSGGD